MIYGKVYLPNVNHAFVSPESVLDEATAFLRANIAEMDMHIAGSPTAEQKNSV